MTNEKRLIDANALISYFSGGEAMKTMTQSIYEAMFVKALQEAPTVDAVEVVRCKDCLHSILPELMTVECTYWHEVVGINGFCHHGERKDNG